MTIQKRISRLFAFALVLALMAALAVPGVAEIQNPQGKYGPAKKEIVCAFSSMPYRLNLERTYTGPLKGITNVTIYKPTSSIDQIWNWVPQFNNAPDATFVVAEQIGSDGKMYGLNFYRTTPRNAVVYPYDPREPDSQFGYTTNNHLVYTDAKSGGTKYYLTAVGNYNNANVLWQTNPNNLSHWI